MTARRQARDQSATNRPQHAYCRSEGKAGSDPKSVGDTITRLPFALLAILMLAGVVVVVTPSPTAQAAPATAVLDVAPACDWSTEYHRTLAELGEDEALWRVSNVTDPYLWGNASDTGAVVSPVVPCSIVDDAVRHEHMHLQQVRMFGSWTFAATVLGADRMEITADCASKLDGSSYTPYVTLAGGCSERDLRDARQLLFAR